MELEDDRIMVAGFIPDGPAAKSQQIKIGTLQITKNVPL
jgi:hypothetical protein